MDDCLFATEQERNQCAGAGETASLGTMVCPSPVDLPLGRAAARETDHSLGGIWFSKSTFKIDETGGESGESEEASSSQFRESAWPFDSSRMKHATVGAAAKSGFSGTWRGEGWYCTY